MISLYAVQATKRCGNATSNLLLTSFHLETRISTCFRYICQLRVGELCFLCASRELCYGNWPFSCSRRAVMHGTRRQCTVRHGLCQQRSVRERYTTNVFLHFQIWDGWTVESGTSCHANLNGHTRKHKRTKISAICCNICLQTSMACKQRRRTHCSGGSVVCLNAKCTSVHFFSKN